MATESPTAARYQRKDNKGNQASRIRPGKEHRGYGQQVTQTNFNERSKVNVGCAAERGPK